ncbi:2-isopropylmalate synthase [Roseateles toxinivorans]|uniref:2-isopropylmalate synthase n=2 Tax=Roseateles toxinivorans TaxID=270368 RepID=A0A4R6QA81_9BURK|nr:2-isopropylmalate synthase [Roseateles toxinivorans]
MATMTMISNPATKYRPAPIAGLPDRQWPNRRLQQAPIWLSTDLRDGNQALFEPMNLARKQRLYQQLVQIGFKEIELGFPAASQIDYDFVRGLIATHQIPTDVTPMVMTQMREDLIARTVESLVGAKRAIVHLYNATAPLWREVVFGMSVEQVMQLIEHHVRYLRRLTDAHPETEWILQYSPETFSATELGVALRACHTAMHAWGISEKRKVIINLPTTVEASMPNVFADQIEWMSSHLTHRQHVILSVHPHNDRGTSVAAAELAMLAGAQRVEGCLFGNGERCGNVDIVTLALNMYTQGVHPGLDFSDINAVARVAEECTQLPIHPRHPYAGDLVYTAFSGSHQDAIKKGFAAQRPDAPWAVPYLPIDPADLGRSYDSVIRVNSQSGKGGIAFLMERDKGLVMPRRMQVEFSAVVQRLSDASEAEVTVDQLWQLFDHTYLGVTGLLQYHGHQLFDSEGEQGVTLDLSVQGQRRQIQGSGNGPIAATVTALAEGFGLALRLDSFEERALGSGADATALALVELACGGVTGARFGAGRHVNTVTASVLAVLSGLNRLLQAQPELLSDRVAESGHAAVPA